MKTIQFAKYLCASVGALGVAASLLASPAVAGAQESDEQRLAALATVVGSFDEGEVELDSRKCRPQDLPPQNRNGKYRDFKTTAGGVSARYEAGEDEFVIRHDYTCRQRTRIVSGCGGAQLGTDDSHSSGTVEIRVTVSRRGLVKVLGEPTGVDQRCGLTIAERAKVQLEGAQL